MQTQTLIKKIENLPAEKIYEVEDFVDFLLAKVKRSVKKLIFKRLQITQRNTREVKLIQLIKHF